MGGQHGLRPRRRFRPLLGEGGQEIHRSFHRPRNRTGRLKSVAKPAGAPTPRAKAERVSVPAGPAIGPAPARHLEARSKIWIY